MRCGEQREAVCGRRESCLGFLFVSLEATVDFHHAFVAFLVLFLKWPRMQALKREDGEDWLVSVLFWPEFQLYPPPTTK